MSVALLLDGKFSKRTSDVGWRWNEGMNGEGSTRESVINQELAFLKQGLFTSFNDILSENKVHVIAKLQSLITLNKDAKTVSP